MNKLTIQSFNPVSISLLRGVPMRITRERRMIVETKDVELTLSMFNVRITRISTSKNSTGHKKNPAGKL